MINFVKNSLLLRNIKRLNIKRIYFYHIRKTGGTSINKMFLSLSGDCPDKIYKNLSNNHPHMINNNGLKYVGWDKKKIEDGDYFYAFSHIPFHDLKLPQNTFTITSFRDPIERVISHYKMLKYYELNDINHPCMKIERKWLGKGFDDFINNIPYEHMFRQLYMFSKDYNVSEALKNINKISHIIILNDFSNGVNKLSNKIKINLNKLHKKNNKLNIKIDKNNLNKLNKMLLKEYELLNNVKESN